MSLVAGTFVGPYEIVGALGAGGMGEVYRARDTKLNRDVALKVLPELFAGDADRLARFKREAHVLASLNHPNIAAIHGFEDSGDVQALVLELVEEPTLADRIAQGRIPLDGQSIAFVRGRQILKMSLDGGPATTLYREDRGSANNAPIQLDWGANDTIVFGSTQDGYGLMQVAASGGTASPLTTLPADEVDHRHPDALPGGEAVLFSAWRSGADIESAQIVAQIVSTGERRTIIAGSAPRFVTSGHLVFAREDGLWAVPFSPARLEVTGPAVRVLEGVRTSNTGRPQLALSATGMLIYEAGGVGGGGLSDPMTLTWVDRKGAEEAVGAPPRAYVYARLSPDGSQIALDARDEQNDIWVWNAQRRNLTRLTFDPGQNISPVWTRDGARIIFGGQPADGAPGLFWQAADGAGSLERLTSEMQLAMPTALSPDNTRLLFHLVLAPRNISALTLNGQRRSEILLQTSFDEANAELSPDGRWVAFSSNESGRYESMCGPSPTSRPDAGRCRTEAPVRREP